MFDIKSLDSLLDQGISDPSIHTAVISDPNGATLTFVDSLDTTSEARNRRVRIIAALGIDAWRESVASNLARETLPSVRSDEDCGAAVGRVECEVCPIQFHCGSTQVRLIPCKLSWDAFLRFRFMGIK
jgi:hypothetical protein